MSDSVFWVGFGVFGGGSHIGRFGTSVSLGFFVVNSIVSLGTFWNSQALAMTFTV